MKKKLDYVEYCIGCDMFGQRLFIRHYFPETKAVGGCDDK